MITKDDVIRPKKRASGKRGKKIERFLVRRVDRESGTVEVRDKDHRFRVFPLDAVQKSNRPQLFHLKPLPSWAGGGVVARGRPPKKRKTRRKK